MEALIGNMATIFMPIIALWFMYRFLKHFAKESEGIFFTSLLFALIVWTFSASVLFMAG